MKILEVTNLFSPVHGGSAKVPYQLSKQLAEREHEVTIYTSDFKLSQDYIDLLPEVKIYAFKTWLGLAGFNMTPGIIRKAKEEIRHLDIIHMHNYRTFQNIIVYHYAKKCGVPYVLQAHGSLATFFHKVWLKRIFDAVWGYSILKDASKMIAVTEAEAEQYKSMGVSEDKIEIIPHGIDLSEFDNLPQRGEFRRRYGLNDNQRIILYLGRIHKIKGIDLLAKAFADLSKPLNDIKLVIAGPDAGYLPPLKKLVADLKISDKVLFTGPLYGQEKLNAYVDSDVHVLPSLYEIFGITVLEACACGIPVIVTDRCGLADVISGQAGLVVPYDKEQLQDALLHLLGNDKLRREFGEKGKLLVREKFNWEKIAEKVERVYIEESSMAKGAMERDWDMRARQDAIRYVANKFQGDAFFEEGTKQAYQLCGSFFQKEGFLPEGKRMLDIGCGIGRMERGFSQMFGEVWGLDVSGEMIAQAIESNRAFKNVKFVKGNGQDLDTLPSDYFDFIFSYITFQHIPEKQIILNYLSEIHRVLQQGGLFKVLIRKQWAGVAFLFGFIPVPRFIFPYIPEVVWAIYENLLLRKDKILCRGKTWRGSGMHEEEAMRVLRSLGFKAAGIEEDPCKVSYWCYGRK